MDVLKGIQRLENLSLEGRRVLMRVDLNCPLGPDGRLVDDSRIHSALPGIRYCIEQGAKVVLASHLGQPGGRRVPELSMGPVGERLAEMLDKDIFMPEECVGDGPRKVVLERVEGEVVLLENLGFYPEEESNDDVFAQRLAQLGDVFVNDAFECSNRPWASVAAVARHFGEKGAGLQLAKELSWLGRLTGAPEQPFVYVAGGTGLGDKLALLNQFLGKVKAILTGGVLATTLLASKGIGVGRSRVERDRVEHATNLLSRARLRGVDVMLPTDVVVAREDSDEAVTEVVAVERIPDDAMIVDIGPDTSAAYAARLAGARTAFWNGPMGLVERRPFRAGSDAVAKAMARSSAQSVVAGEDTVAAVGRLVLTPFFKHVSMGGHTAVAFLEGQELPGVEGLRDLG